MSLFGLLSLLLFLIVMGVLVILEYGDNSDLAFAKVMTFVLRLMVFAHICLALYEFPCYVADGIVFISMGNVFIAKIMFIIVGLIILFILGFILPRIKWGRYLTPTPAKLIFLGLLFICCFSYNEIAGGVYSFDSYDEFRSTKAAYEEVDNRFWPTKYIKHHSKFNDEDRIALYPFDVTTSLDEEVFLYKGETVSYPTADGSYDIYYYPFTWKLYDGGETALLYSENPPVIIAPEASSTDVPAPPAEGTAPEAAPQNTPAAPQDTPAVPQQ